MHPAEAFHGDLGMVTADDIVIAISNSGESNEVVNILSIIHRIGARIIAMSGRRKSQLGRSADFYIDIGVEREAGACADRIDDGNARDGRCSGNGTHGGARLQEGGLCALSSGRGTRTQAPAHCSERHAHGR